MMLQHRPGTKHPANSCRADAERVVGKGSRSRRRAPSVRRGAGVGGWAALDFFTQVGPAVAPSNHHMHSIDVW